MPVGIAGRAGGLLGAAAGLAVMESLPAVFGSLLPVHTVLAFPWRSIGAGIGTGLLTTLLFCLPPLLDVRAVRPVLVLRRLVESGPSTISGVFYRIWARRLQFSIALLVLAALGAIAWALSDSRVVGTWFALGLASALLVLLALAAVTLRVLRFLLNRVRLYRPSFLRHGLANLYRPGNQSAAVLASLGTGVMLILAVYLMQASVLRDIRETASPKVPNLFLIDITTQESAPLTAFFNHLPGVVEPLDLLPVVRGQFVSLNGTPLDQLKQQHLPRRFLENAELTWADAPPLGDKVTQGTWWTNPGAQQIAMPDGFAQRLHLGVGSVVELNTPSNGLHKVTIAALFKAD